MNDSKLEQYAAFMVRSAVNVQKGQTLIINSPIEAASFARLCAEEAYKAGVYDVVVHYSDEKMARIRMRDAAVEALEEVQPWRLRSYMDYVQTPGGACVLSILARDPEIYKGLDTGKIDRASVALERAMKPWREQTMGNRLQWSIASVPSEAWAKRVFPGKDADEAQRALWEAIYRVCRVEQGRPEEAWRQHAKAAALRVKKLQEMELSALRLQSENGTDLTVGLAEEYQFAGVEEKTVAGIPFFANVPSEEVFTAPHKERVEGVVKSSMPYVYNGNLIEGIWARFEKGRAVEYGAEKGEDLLRQMMDTDEGAKHLGEIALVPASSPVRKTGLLFYNTLFDENAACHIAFGAGYPGTVKGGDGMDREQLAQKGLNDSLIHEDVMVGTEDMEITGLSKSGKEWPVFQKGEWAF
ncbi:aminopeptidase [Ruminococcaceae bacterium OttesenSCG-928-I18]|nr:aminopeptidase [Ruminococcaceae bacterium OttesenSCG-928-I18]